MDVKLVFGVSLSKDMPLTPISCCRPLKRVRLRPRDTESGYVIRRIGELCDWEGDWKWESGMETKRFTFSSVWWPVDVCPSRLLAQLGASNRNANAALSPALTLPLPSPAPNKSLQTNYVKGTEDWGGGSMDGCQRKSSGFPLSASRRLNITGKNTRKKKEASQGDKKQRLLEQKKKKSGGKKGKTEADLTTKPKSQRMRHHRTDSMGNSWAEDGFCPGSGVHFAKTSIDFWVINIL